ncbi:MAG: hypothetical protein JSS72_01005 [Armatimonadetes bacterium]|nr:hypothetical protein [Armatimonadota bacterium]
MKYGAGLWIFFQNNGRRTVMLKREGDAFGRITFFRRDSGNWKRVEEVDPNLRLTDLMAEPDSNWVTLKTRDKTMWMTVHNYTGNIQRGDDIRVDMKPAILPHGKEGMAQFPPHEVSFECIVE